MTRSSDCRLFLLALAGATPLVAQADPDPVAMARATLEQWRETQALVSKEARDWAVAKDALAARSDLIKREIVALQKRTAEAEASIAAAEQKRGELQAENDVHKATLATLEQRIGALEQRLSQTLGRLPEPLREKIKPFSQRLPKPGETPGALLTDRYAAVVVVLNELHKWNREVTVANEVRAQPDGSNVEVAVLYAGLGQAWYVGGKGQVAGYGGPTADGWRWTVRNDLGPAILQAIAVWKNEQPATFVKLPVQVQ